MTTTQNINYRCIWIIITTNLANPIQYDIMTSSNGNIFCVTGHLSWEFTGDRWIPSTNGPWRGASMFSLICALNKRLSKQSWGRRFETPSRSLLRHYNELEIIQNHIFYDDLDSIDVYPMYPSFKSWPIPRIPFGSETIYRVFKC